MNNKLGLVTGSFDPITVGHVDIVSRAARIFGKVIVVVAQNEEKEYMFSQDERVAIVKAAVKHLNNVEVEICNGYVADFAKEHNADAFVRGIRGGADVAYEQNMADVNFANSGVDTVLLFAKPEYHLISSTVVRDLLMNNKDLNGYMLDESASLAKTILNSRK